MNDPSISVLECLAMRLLAEDGWTFRELRMVFETSQPTVQNHVNGECVYHKGETNLGVPLKDVDPDDVPALGGPS